MAVSKVRALRRTLEGPMYLRYVGFSLRYDVGFVLGCKCYRGRIISIICDVPGIPLF